MLFLVSLPTKHVMSERISLRSWEKTLHDTLPVRNVDTVVQKSDFVHNLDVLYISTSAGIVFSN